jgi:hypothetical protein
MDTLILYQYVQTLFNQMLNTKHLVETFANVVYNDNTMSEYFLCIMNGSSILGAVV